MMTDKKPEVFQAKSHQEPTIYDVDYFHEHFDLIKTRIYEERRLFMQTKTGKMLRFAAFIRAFSQTMILMAGMVTFPVVSAAKHDHNYIPLTVEITIVVIMVIAHFWGHWYRDTYDPLYMKETK